MGFTTASTSAGTTNSSQLIMLYGVIFTISWIYTLVYTSDLANWITENILTDLVPGRDGMGLPALSV